MDVPDFWSYAFIWWRMGKTATETFKDLSTISLISLLTVSLFLAGWRRWRLEKGSFTLEKGTSSGRPRETRTPENISRVQELIEENPRLSAY